MKGLLLKNETMPENCYDCSCLRQDSWDGIFAYQCNLTLAKFTPSSDGRMPYCPLVEIEIPDEHGDLIDRDALLESLSVNLEECPGCPGPEWLQSFADTLDTAEVAVKARKKNG